jgi:hydroxymethylpyrimidine kinase / phosphomethylpyrimidine kinase / thiamine-phosphate diphosphorylase
MSLLTNPFVPPPIVWTIAGSDSCAGAGIQCDLKTFAALGVHGATVVTTLTAQNSHTVLSIEPVSASILDSQISALIDDMPPRAIKIGMFGNADGVQVISKHVASLNSYIVCDPVLIASAGSALVGEDVILSVIKLIFPYVNLLTPNIHEAQILTKRTIANEQDVENAASDILALGVKSVVIKGWDSGVGYVQDFYCSAEQSFWLTSPCNDKKDSRGTGCTFASTIAAAHACGFSASDTVVIAKAYVNQARRLQYNAGKGLSILSHAPWPCMPQDIPWLTPTAQQGQRRSSFPTCGEFPLGFYPIVDSLKWLAILLPRGIKTAQLRIKNTNHAVVESEIARAISLARHYNCRLFINDYWQLAIKYGAYGIHLGQEDITTADIPAIAKSGLRLGLSTHCYTEVARAHGLGPSYMAIGPIFPTTLKAMKFSPQGIEAFRIWRHVLDYPLVAIGGLTLDKGAELIDVGADGIAVVSDITQNLDPIRRTEAWLSLFNSHQNVRKPYKSMERQRHSA